MIQLSARLIELLNRAAIEPFYLVEIDTNTRLTSYMRELTLSDSRVYSTGDFVALDPPRMSSSVDRESYRITIADPRMEYGAMFEAGMVGKSVEIRVGLVDLVTSQPELNVDNTFVIYRGAIDGVSYQIDTSEKGESLALITCTSPMANLDMTKPFYTSKDFLRQIDPADTSFDQIYDGSGPVQLKWGKK